MNQTGQYKLLLVEDEPIIAFTESLLLNKQNYDVVIAQNGESAIQLALQDSEIDLILMDINLGIGIDGTEASKQILEKRELPIVFLTSHSEKEILAKVKQITRYGLIIKNSGQFVLLSTIEMALDLFKTKQELTKAEKRWNTALETTEHGVWELDTRTNQVYISTKTRLVIGLKSDVSSIPLSNWESLIHPDYQELVSFLLNSFLSNKEAEFTVSYKIMHSEGYPVWIKHLGSAIERDSDGKVLSMIATIVPINSEFFVREKLNKISVHIPGVIYQYRVRKDGSSHFPYSSEGMFDIYSVRPQDVVDDASPVFDVIHPDDINNVAVSVAKSQQELTKWKNTYRVFKNNQIIVVEGEASPERLLDGSTIWHGYIRKISEQKEDRIPTIDKSNLIELAKHQFDTAPIAVFIADKNGKYTYVNHEAATMLKYTQQELLQLWVKDVATNLTDYEEQFKEMIEKSKLKNRSVLKKKDGEITIVMFNAFQLDEDNFVSFVFPINELYEANVKLEEQKQYFERILDLIPLNIYRINRFGKIDYANKYYFETTKLTESEMIGKTAYDMYPIEDADKYWRDDQRVFKTKKVYKTIEKNVNPNTKVESFVQVIKSPVIESDEKVSGIVGIFYDITSSIQEEKAKNLLIEHQNVLIREVHHRIKNNLSMMMGMMNLQAIYTDNKEVKDILSMTVTRIAAIGTMYEKLYQSRDTEHVEMSAYLNSILGDMMQTIIPKFITIKHSFGKVSLPERFALIIGISLVELLTNSIKYAFPEDQRDKNSVIKVVVSQKDDLLELIVEDNGIGIPDEIKIGEKRGFGYSMIDSLCKQIGASIDFDQNHKSKVRVIARIEN